EEPAPKITERILVSLSLSASRGPVAAPTEWTRLARAHALAADRLSRRDVDHDRREFFRQRDEIGQAARRFGRRRGVRVFRERRLLEITAETAAGDEADRQNDGRHRDDGS